MHTKSLLLGLLLLLPPAARSASPQQWIQVNPNPHGDDLREVRFLNNQFMAVGEQGRFGTSTDGIQWNWQRIPDAELLTAVLYNDGRTVCLGSNGDAFVSDDEATWEKHSLGDRLVIDGGIFANGLYVALGYRTVESPSFFQRATILTSSDGIQWTEAFVLLGAGSDRAWFRDAVFAQNQFVVVGGQITGTAETRVVTSPDGQNWAVQNPSTASPFSSVAFGEGRYVAVGPQTYFATSTDGIDWTGDYDFVYRSGVAFGNGRFAAVPGNIPFGGFPSTSTTTDGVDWSSQPIPINQPLTRVAFGNGTFVAVGTLGQVLTSSDGETWTQRTEGALSAHSLYSIAHGAGQFVAVSEGLGQINSVNGDAWLQSDTGFFPVLKSVIHAEGRFVAAGGFTSTDMVTSPDGVNWTSHDPDGVATSIYDLEFTPTPAPTYVGVGGENTPIILTSGNATDWTDNSPAGDPVVVPVGALQGVAFGNDVFVTVGKRRNGVLAPNVMTSTDGTNWTPLWTNSNAANSPIDPTSESVYLYSVNFLNGQFVAGGVGLILTSSDGSTWVKHKNSDFGQVNGSAYHDSLYVLVGTGGRVNESTNMIDWNLVYEKPGTDLREVKFLEGTFYAVGANATVLRRSRPPIQSPILPIGTNGYLLAEASLGADFFDGLLGNTRPFTNYLTGTNLLYTPVLAMNEARVALTNAPGEQEAQARVELSINTVTGVITNNSMGVSARVDPRSVPANLPPVGYYFKNRAKAVQQRRIRAQSTSGGPVPIHLDLAADGSLFVVNTLVNNPLRPSGTVLMAEVRSVVTLQLPSQTNVVYSGNAMVWMPGGDAEVKPGDDWANESFPLEEPPTINFARFLFDIQHTRSNVISVPHNTEFIIDYRLEAEAYANLGAHFWVAGVDMLNSSSVRLTTDDPDATLVELTPVALSNLQVEPQAGNVMIRLLDASTQPPYDLQYTDEFGVWNPLSTMTVDGADQVLLDVDQPPSGRRFYRAIRPVAE